MLGLRYLVLAGMALCLADSVLAEAPESSLRPLLRPMATAEAPKEAPKPEPQVVQAATQAAAQTASLASLRPRPRPSLVLASTPPVAPNGEEAAAPRAERKPLFGFLRPSKRPDDLAEKTAALRAPPGKQAVASKKGSVCGIPDIKGETLAPIPARIKGCGIANPVRVTSVAGIRLSNPATINCDTAQALRAWVTKAVEPAYGKGKVVELKVAASYACRPRNNKRGAKVSEHGRGNAIDIAGFTFSNGKSVSVLRNYDKTMRKVHKAACGTFGTTLGPGSDGFHEDHLHFDVARHRGGPYCR